MQHQQLQPHLRKDEKEKGRKKGTYNEASLLHLLVTESTVHHPSFPFLPINPNPNFFSLTEINKLRASPILQQITFNPFIKLVSNQGKTFSPNQG